MCIQEERERKRLEQLERKKEAQKLLTEEIASIHTIKPPAAAKLTRAEIQAQQERMAAAGMSTNSSHAGLTLSLSQLSL